MIVSLLKIGENHFRRRRIILVDICKLFLGNIPWPTWIVATDSTILFLNKCYEEMYNIRLSDVVGKNYKEVLPKQMAEQYYRELEACIRSGEVYVSEQIINNRWIQCNMFPLFNQEREIVAVAGVAVDVTDKKEREQELEEQKGILRTIIDAVPEVIFYKDKSSRFIGYNKKFESYYNERGIYDILGKSDLEIYKDKEVAKQFIDFDQEVMRSREAKYFEQTFIQPNGERRIEENAKIPVIGKDGEVWGVVGLSRDVTEQKRLEAKLRRLSEIDALTGLYNRHSFEEKIKQYNTEAYLPLGIIMGDVNGLKLVNDTLGHLEGDKLLKGISKVLQDTCGQKGNVFRWGGDEFVILLPNCNEAMCEAVIDEIEQACKEDEQQFVQLSIALGETVKHTLEDNIYDYIVKVEKKVYRQKLLERKSVKNSMLDALRKTLEEKSMETNEHTSRVVSYALAIGKKMGFKKSELDDLVLSAQLHDIGKITISEELLLKQGELSEDEYEILKTHSEKGYRIIHACGELINVGKCVLTHHERWDGTGYPLGLKGEEIPLMARIISVVDAYDVMTHDRTYKKAKSKQMAIEELRRCSGSQFDPSIVDLFIDYLGCND